MSKRTTADTTLIYTKIVERYASFFERPEVRLRFLNGTLAQQNARQAQLHRALRRVNTYLTQRYQTTRTVGITAGQNAAVPANSAKYLPNYRPEKVWPVEQKENYEFYSNGGRILKDYETDNHPRGYYVFRRGG